MNANYSLPLVFSMNTKFWLLLLMAVTYSTLSRGHSSSFAGAGRSSFFTGASRGGVGSKICTHCGRTGHTIDVFYAKHGYPPGHRASLAGHASLIAPSPPLIALPLYLLLPQAP
ncbi:uncharacterized protein DS421_16g558180 [Arachis hypogaea]|nr:uncharacterized protein DS421_16g558180 [Arachis hypogaea]